jgi:DNA-binding transcriptional MerR regulator
MKAEDSAQMTAISILPGGPNDSMPGTYSLEEVAARLDVPEATVREWLANFRWERRYDGAGLLLLEDRDLEFLRLIKSLKDVDRSCESIVRLIADEPDAQPELPAVEADPTANPISSDCEQMETLKAELKELHAKPFRPFWKFWSRF